MVGFRDGVGVGFLDGVLDRVWGSGFRVGVGVGVGVRVRVGVGFGVRVGFSELWSKSGFQMSVESGLGVRVEFQNWGEYRFLSQNLTKPHPETRPRSPFRNPIQPRPETRP